MEKNVFNFFFAKEAWNIYIMCSLTTQKKPPQTLKMGLKRGVNGVKHQISLPDTERLKKRCLSGKNQILPESRANHKKNKTAPRKVIKKIKTVPRKVIKKMYTYTKKNLEQV